MFNVSFGRYSIRIPKKVLITFCFLVLLGLVSVFATSKSLENHSAYNSLAEDPVFVQTSFKKEPHVSKIGANGKSSVQKSGGVSPAYSRKTCQKVAVPIAGQSSLQKPGLNSSNSNSSYNVHGADISQVRNQLVQCGPDGYFAATSYNMNWKFGLSEVGDSCRLVNVRVGISTKVLMPKWVEANKSASDQKKWNLMYSNLLAHEQRHVSISNRQATLLLSELKYLQAKSCESLLKKANSITAVHVSKLKSSNAQYDSATSHGMTEGASF